MAVLGAGVYDETTLTPDSAYRLIYGEDHLVRRLGLILEALYEYTIIAVYR